MPHSDPPTRRRTDRINLVRHGETDWSLTGRHTGRTDVAPTAQWEDEALALAPELAPVRFGHVLTSPARRARRTCALAGLGALAEVELDLAEWDYGDYEGRLSADVIAGRPGWSVCHDGCPGGETPPDVSGRADRVIPRRRALDGHVALFSYGQFGCSLEIRWISLSINEARHFQLDPASVSILGWNPSHPRLAVIARWNTSPWVMGGYWNVSSRSLPVAP